MIYDLFIFIGGGSKLSKFLANEIKSANKVDIFAISRKITSSKYYDKVFSYNELNSDFDNYLSKYRKICLVNIASLVPSLAKDEFEFFEVNNSFIPRQLKRLASKSSALINISTADVYNFKFSIAEESIIETMPSTLYGLSKNILEKQVKEIANYFNIPYLNIRIPVLIYPGVQNNFISSWIDKISSNEKINYSNPDGSFNNLGDARTLADILLIDLNNLSFHVLNIASKDTCKIIDLVKLISSITEYNLTFFNEVNASKQSQLMGVSNISKIQVRRFTIFETLDWFLSTSRS